ncbi:hypothetical protein Sjap_025533 [Stephania japonica]|uniref:At1g61320/AtMIF1 LRR domain-containing protein n=1 Tax=Stephania japonica TaxID=461633 RepID=A0AAP0HHM5_9MAGN
MHTDRFDFREVFARAQTRQQFIDTVNRYLQLHNGSKIHNFRLLFDPDIQNQVHADKWLEFAIQRSVEELDFDFCGRTVAFDYHLGSERLKLPDLLYSSDSPLTHLKLGQFHFNPPLAFTGFASLVSLYLRRVNITDDTLESLLMKCPLITDLSLCKCDDLKNIKILGPKLERLLMFNCNAITNIDFLAPNLKSFHFHGEPYMGYSFQEVCALEDVYLYTNGSFELQQHILTTAYVYSTVKVLTFCSGFLTYISSTEEHAPEGLPFKFPHLQELQILVRLPMDEYSLDLFDILFEHTICPCLEKLFIEFSARDYHPIWQSQLDEGEEEEELAACWLDNLKIVKITNFRGTTYEMRFVKVILSKCLSLEQMVIVAAQNFDQEKQMTQVSDSSTATRTAVGELLITPKVSNGARIVVCRDWEADSKNLSHTHANVRQMWI